MTPELVAELEQMVREGDGLRQAITKAGLPLKATMLELRRNHRQQFRDAKVEQVAVRRRIVERDAKALQILREPVKEETPRGR